MAVLLIGAFLSGEFSSVGEIFIFITICGALSLVLYLFYRGNRKAHFLVTVMVGYGIWNIFFILIAETSKKIGWLNDLGKLEPSQVATRFTILMLVSLIPVLWIFVTSKTMENVKTFGDYQRQGR